MFEYRPTSLRWGFTLALIGAAILAALARFARAPRLELIQIRYQETFLAYLKLALVAGLYTAAGGLAAVVYTDAIQAVVLLLGSCLLTWVIFGRLDFSWSQVRAATPPEMLSLIRPIDDPRLPWLGTLIGVPVLGFYFWCTNQFIVQRVLGARSVAHARWGALLAGLLKLISVIQRLAAPIEIGDFLLTD